MEIASDEEGGRLQSCACSVYGVGVEQFICLLTFKGKMKWSWNITVLNSWRLVPPLYLDTPRHHYLSFMKCLTASETEVDVTTGIDKGACSMSLLLCCPHLEVACLPCSETDVSFKSLLILLFTLLNQIPF